MTTKVGITFEGDIKDLLERYDENAGHIFASYDQPRYQLFNQYGNRSYSFDSVEATLEYAAKIEPYVRQRFTLQDRGYTVTLQQFVEARS